MVRSFLNGRFENTAFCLLSPDGKERLSRSGRGPHMAFGGRRGAGGAPDTSTIEAMEKIARRYKPDGDPHTPVLQDFHSFRQALNVASGDQRLLLVIAAGEKDRDALRPVMGHADIIGKFHTDFLDSETDQNWHESISGAGPETTIAIVQADKFGQNGTLLKQLPTGAGPSEVQAALLAANSQFAKTEQRKTYRDHVREGRRNGIFFEREIEYGEDRDGDGKIDHRGGLDRRQSGRRETPHPNTPE